MPFALSTTSAMFEDAQNQSANSQGVREAASYRIGISGSYGGFNHGDEAILQVIVSELRRSFPVDITVFSRDAQDTRRRHEVEDVVSTSGLSRREAREIVASLDLFILGGGGILYDADADMYLREVLMLTKRTRLSWSAPSALVRS